MKERSRLLVRKRIQRNYYKNSTANRRAKIIQRFKLCLKTVAVIASLHLISFLFIFSYDFLTQCDYFRAENLAVIGAERLTRQQILDQAQVTNGTNIYSLNLSMARKRLLAHPWIAEAEVSREPPSGVNIRVKEHNPIAVIDLGRKFLINAHGEIFKEMTTSNFEHLPVIKGLEFSDINVQGEPRSAPFSAVMDVLELGQKPDSVLPNTLIKKINVDREIGITIYAFDRIKSIKIGYDNYQDKYAKLKNVLSFLNKRNGLSHLDSIDINNLNRIVVNPARIESPAGDQKEV